ncbi:MAG: DUF4062 domain-containing protein [Clostridiaceae bacterium]|nr:DUF4062 domain-containing protein [Clostridiaceae bacterium]
MSLFDFFKKKPKKKTETEIEQDTAKTERESSPIQAATSVNISPSTVETLTKSPPSKTVEGASSTHAVPVSKAAPSVNIPPSAVETSAKSPPSKTAEGASSTHAVPVSKAAPSINIPSSSVNTFAKSPPSRYVAKVGAVKWENVYVFISSTFNDMHAERDYLVKRVFPELAEWCEKRRLHLVDIDLRWGITQEDSEKNKRVVEVCLSNIDKCRPFFLCFMGQRRGWIPSKSDISDNTFKEFPKLSSYMGSSVTEMEIIHALIDPMLNGSIEDLKKQERAFFFLRDPNYLKNIKNQAIRNIYTNEGEDDSSKADAELTRFKTETIAKSGRPVYIYNARWNDSGFTPELAACAAPGAASQTLTKGRLTDFSCENRELSEVVISEMKKAILERFPARNKIVYQTDTPLQSEIDQQAQFLQMAADGFIAREGDFEAISDYLANDERRPFVVCAEAGLGKTSFLAHFVELTLAKSEHALVYRFIGVSNESASLHRLLSSVLQELKTEGMIKSPLPLSPSDVKNKFGELLSEVGSAKKVIIVIDALNQLESGLSDLSWIPWVLPQNIKLILSFKLGDKDGDALARLISDEKRAVISKIRPFENSQDKKNLISQYLSRYLKKLDDESETMIVHSPGSANPLFMKILLSELRVFGSHGDLKNLINNRFGDSPLSAFDAVLNRLEHDSSYSPISPDVLTANIFGWLSHSKKGLTIQELTGLLIHHKLTDDHEKAADAVHLLLRQLRPYIAIRGGRVDFFYESFYLAARNRYTTIRQLSKSDARWHREIAEYFEKLPFDAERFLSEIAYQYAHAGMSEELCSLLLNYRFLELRIKKTDVSAAIEDYSYARLPEAHVDSSRQTELTLIGDALGLSSVLLTQNVTQLPIQLFGRLMGFDLPLIKRLLADTEQYLKNENRPWFRPLSPCLPAPGNTLMYSYKGIDINTFKIFKDRKRILLSSAIDNTIKLIEIASGKVIKNYPVNTLIKNRGYGSFDNFLLLEDDNKIAVRTHNQLYIADLDSAESKLVEGFSGSMNQRMFSGGGMLLSHDIKIFEKSFKIHVVDIKKAEIIHTFSDNVQKVPTGIAFSGDASLLFIGTDDNKISAFDVKNSFSLAYTIGEHPDLVTDILPVESRNLLIAKSANHIYIWRIDDGKLLLNVYAGFMESFALSNDERVLAVGSSGTIDLYSLDSFKNLKRIWTTNKNLDSLISSDKFTSIIFSDDNNTLFVGRELGDIQVWDLKSASLLSVNHENTNKVTALALSEDEGILVSDGVHNPCCVWDLKKASVTEDNVGMKALHVTSAALSADDSFILSMDEMNVISKIDTITMKFEKIASVKGGTAEILISLDGKHFAVRKSLNEMHMFRCDTAELIGTYKAFDAFNDPEMAKFWKPAFLPAEACLTQENRSIVYHQGNCIIVQDIDKPNEPVVVRAFEGQISWFRLFDCGRKLLVLSAGRTVGPVIMNNISYDLPKGAKIYDTRDWTCLSETEDYISAYLEVSGLAKYKSIADEIRKNSGGNIRDFIPLVIPLYENNGEAIYLKQTTGNHYTLWNTKETGKIADLILDIWRDEFMVSGSGKTVFSFGLGKTLYPLRLENAPLL